MKTICIYHSRNLDGWMSAAIVKKWNYNNAYCSVCKHILPKNNAGSTKCCGGITILNHLDFLGWDYEDDIPNLSDYDKIIMVNVSFDKKEMNKLYDRLIENFIWIDHHSSAIKKNDNLLITGIQNTDFAACELTWDYFFPYEKMPEIVRLLGMYSSFRHKKTDEEQKVLEFQYGARACISNYENCYRHLDDKSTDDILYNGKIIYQCLCTEVKQTYAKAFPIEFFEPINKILKFFCVNREYIEKLIVLLYAKNLEKVDMKEQQE